MSETDEAFETVRREFYNLPDVLMVGPPSLDESFARFDAALASLRTQLQQAEQERDRQQRIAEVWEATAADYKAQLQQAEQERAEALTMLATHVCPYHDLTEATARAERAESQLQQAEARLGDAESALRKLLVAATAGHEWVSSVYVEDITKAGLASSNADPKDAQ